MTQDDRLLIVDDEAGIRFQFRGIAEALGYEVAEASDARQFDQVYEDFHPDLIMLDLGMPGTDGVELLRRLAAADHAQCGVILISGRGKKLLVTAERLGRSLDLRMHPSLQKPIPRARLEQALREASEHAEKTQISRGDLQTEPITREELRAAIESGQLTPYFQPKVDLQADQGFPIIGAEALARWNHPELGLVPPDRFIPLAEKTGLIGKLTESMFNAIIIHIQSWAKAGIALPISLNLSPKQLTDLSLPDAISDRLRETGIDPSLLIMEVTEQAAMTDIDAATDILTRLRLKDIQVSLDDFGAGYSSLVEIYRLPLSEIKFDRSLAKDLDHDADARTVVRALTQLAHALDLTVCVEGTETAETAAFLKESGCQRAQGFHFSHPLTPTQFEVLLAGRDAQR